jgi:hypothetical protein
MKSYLRAIPIVIACLSFGLLITFASSDQEVPIESQESKTVDDGPVFNKIRWFRFQEKDVWMMNQSHHGFSAENKSWDRLAIVIDKTKAPKTARFYQFEAGPLEWREDLPQKPFRVACFMCHNNGPRAIRPNYDSLSAPIELADKVKISYWNLRIKLYGRIVVHPAHEVLDETQMPPFRVRSSYENEPLSISTCTNCHKESGFLARGLLRRQQLSTIKFMIEAGQMPPLGFWLSNNEKRELEMFLQGF